MRPAQARLTIMPGIVNIPNKLDVLLDSEIMG
jgi:hypothetical protein